MLRCEVSELVSAHTPCTVIPSFIHHIRPETYRGTDLVTRVVIFKEIRIYTDVTGVQKTMQ